MNSKALRILTLVAASVSAPAALADYTIQIGAYAKPEHVDHSRAAALGDVQSYKGKSGLTRILVGRFASGDEARATLDALRAAGYRDAFVTRAPGSGWQPARAPAGTDTEPQMRWHHLDPELRAKLVLLDGRPYIKEGQSFTPLEEYKTR